jgi:hypothetical protein
VSRSTRQMPESRAGLHVEEVAHVVVGRAVVPDDRRLAAGQPLQHAALLPAPGRSRAQLDPAVAVGQIDHADLDRVVGFGRAMLETDLHAQHVAVGGVEFQLVVVAEPVVFRPPRDDPRRRQRVVRRQRTAGARRAEGQGRRGGSSQKVASSDRHAWALAVAACLRSLSITQRPANVTCCRLAPQAVAEAPRGIALRQAISCEPHFQSNAHAGCSDGLRSKFATITRGTWARSRR